MMKFIRSLKILLLFVTITQSHLSWADEPFNASFEVLNTPAKWVNAPRLSLFNDSLLLSWTEQSNHQTLATLKFSTFKNQQWSKPKVVASGTDWFINYADYAEIIPLTDNHLIASWLEHDSESKFDYFFKVSQSFNAGETWSKPISPIQNKKGENGFLSAISYNDKALLAWISTVGDGFEVQSTILNQHNEFSPIMTIDVSSCSCCHTDMVKHNNQALLVYRDRTANEIRDIALTSYQNNSWSNPIIIHQDNWEINGCPVNAPAIASNQSGYAITWFSAANNQEKVHLTAKNNANETFFKTLETSSTFGYVDITPVSDSKVVLSRLSTKDNDLLLKLQYFNIKDFSLDQTINIKQTDFSGFPSIAYYRGNTYIVYTTANKEIKFLRVNNS